MMEEYKKKKILIVNDEEKKIKYFEEEIEKNFPEKYELIKFLNADRVIDSVNKGLEYDLAILDSCMYAEGVGNHGGELVARISKKKNPKTKIIMISAWFPDSQEDIDALLSFFNYEYTLSKLINRYLENSEE
jgi:CheY-like chemotaxis protein